MNEGKRYARITDSGECYKSLAIVIDGVYANEKAWGRHNFKPNDGMVGELILHHDIPVIKINDDILVPISRHGYEEVSREEYEASKTKELVTHVSFPSLNVESLDALIGREEFQRAFDKTGITIRDIKVATTNYCDDAKQYIASMSDDLQPRIKAMIKQLENQEVEQFPYKSVISIFTSWIKDEMTEFNWMNDDYKGVAWLCCLYAKAYIECLGELTDKTFEGVFSDLFLCYNESL